VKHNRLEATQQPTRRRLQKARDEGQVARSSDLSSVLFLLITACALMFLVPQFMRLGQTFLKESLSYATGDSTKALTDVGWQLLGVLAFPCLILFVGAVFSGFVQVGALFSPTVIEPRFSRLCSGSSRLFGSRGGMNVLFSLSKLILASLAATFVVLHFADQLFALGTSDRVLDGVHAIVSIGSQAVFAALAVLFLLGVCEYCWQRHAWKTDLLMTRQEIIEEHREHGGRGAESRNYANWVSGRSVGMIVPSLIIVGSKLAVSLRWNASTMTAPIVLDILRGESFFHELEKFKKDGIVVIENNVLVQKIMRGSDVGLGIPSFLHGEIASLLITKKRDAR